MATILCPRTTCLRSFPSAARTLSTPTTSLRAAFTTSSKPAPRFPTHPFTSNIAAAAALQTSRRCALTQIGLRHASQASASSSDVPEHILTWNRFFELRKKRRYLNLGCSVITALATVGVVTPILVRQDLDSWGAQISGIPDPTIVLGIYAFIVAAGGWLAGPSFGNAMFTVWAARRGWNKLIAEKEKSFFARIKRYRADPSASSPQNPIPDYYGEKIASVKDYRRWLKDQKAFNLKKDRDLI